MHESTHDEETLQTRLEDLRQQEAEPQRAAEILAIEAELERLRYPERASYRAMTDEALSAEIAKLDEQVQSPWIDRATDLTFRSRLGFLRDEADRRAHGGRRITHPARMGIPWP